MIRKLKSAKYRLYSRKVYPQSRHRRNLGTFGAYETAEKHEREIQYFSWHGGSKEMSGRRLSASGVPSLFRTSYFAMISSSRISGVCANNSPWESDRRYHRSV